MKILTTNASGRDIFGGIHTHLEEHVSLSPNHQFTILELNSERKHIQERNKLVRKFDLESLIGIDNLSLILENVSSLEEFHSSIDPLINEFEKVIRIDKPDRIALFGTSLTSYALSEAAKRENFLDRTVQSYAGVLEKEVASYTGMASEILKYVGKSFTNDDSLKKVRYIFPSKLCQETVEDIHRIDFGNNAVVIPNGISNAFVEGQRIPPSKESLGFVGRITPVKNPDFFIDLGENLENETELKIITDLYAAIHKPSGMSLIKKITQGKILYYPPMQRQKLANFYSKELSANIVPSLFETFCNVATESLVCGTPVIISDRAGSKEIFEKYGLSKLVFSIDNFDSFLDSYETARRAEFIIPQEISKGIYEELSWPKVIERYNEVIER